MTIDDRLEFGERAVSWMTVWNDLYSDQPFDPHDDAAAAEMHRLRGLVLAQAAELEAALGQVLLSLQPSSDLRRRTAGRLLRDVREALPANLATELNEPLALIDKAIDRRNHTVHSSVEIGSVWNDYATGGGEWTAVISLMNGEEYDEHMLRDDLQLQQQATVRAVTLLRTVRDRVAETAG